MAIRIKIRRDTEANWVSSNAVLAEGELGYDTTNNQFKVGKYNNSNTLIPWNDLAYATVNPVMLDSLSSGFSSTYIPDSQRGIAGGIAELNGDGVLPVDQINLTLQQVAVDGSVTTSYSNINTIQFDEDSGFTVTGPDDNIAKIAMNSTFKYWEVDGTLKLTAQGLDTVNFIHGTGITITANGGVSPQTITFAVDSTIATKTYVDDAISSFQALPSQSGNNGKFLTTNGSTTSWATVDLSSKQDKVTGVSDTEIGYLDGVTSAIQTQIDSKAPIDSPTFTGTVSGITKAMVGLNNVNNTSDANKPISNATQTALDLKADLAGPTLTGTTHVNNLEISGALTFTGTATQIDQTNLTIQDSLIYLADAQFNTDLLDIGIYGAYGVTGHTGQSGHLHTGFVRDHTDKKWKLISGGSEPTSNIVDFTGVTYDTLKVGSLEGNVTGNVTGDVSGNAGTVTNGVYTTDTGTVTNTMLAGSIANSKLSNSKVTVGTTDISLGSSATAISGITTINSTTIPTSKTLTVTTDKLSVFASTSSSELAGVISDETGSGSLVFGSSPTLKGSIYFQSAGGAGGTANYITVNNSTGALSLVSGYPLNLTASGDVTITATGGAVKVGSDTVATLTATQTLSGKTISGSSNTLSNIPNSALSNSSITINGSAVSLGGSVSITSLPSQSGNSGKYLTTDGSNASWSALPISTSTSTISANTATTVDTVALSSFTTNEYTISIKQGSKVRSSKVIVQTDGTSVDMTEFAITETGGTMSGIAVSASVSSTNMILTITITDATSTNATVKLIKQTA